MQKSAQKNPASRKQRQRSNTSIAEQCVCNLCSKPRGKRNKIRDGSQSRHTFDTRNTLQQLQRRTRILQRQAHPSGDGNQIPNGDRWRYLDLAWIAERSHAQLDATNANAFTIESKRRHAPLATSEDTTTPGARSAKHFEKSNRGAASAAEQMT